MRSERVEAVWAALGELSLLEVREFVAPFRGSMSMQRVADLIAERNTPRVSVYFEPPLALVIQAIKMVRQRTGLGLKAAKDVVDDARNQGKPVVANATPEEAEAWRADFESIGVRVRIAA